MPIVGGTVMPMIASCIHHITQRMTNGLHRSKNVVLIMPSGWTASNDVSSSQRCMKQTGRTGWSTSDGGRGRCAGRTSVKSHEISRDRSVKWLRESIAGF